MNTTNVYIYIYFRSVWFWASFVWLLLEAKSFVELNASTSNINFWGPTTCLVSCFRSDVCDTRKYSNAVQCRKWYDMVVFDLQFMVVNLHEIFGSWGNGMVRYMAREHDIKNWRNDMEVRYLESAALVDQIKYPRHKRFYKIEVETQTEHPDYSRKIPIHINISTNILTTMAHTTPNSW